MAAESADDEVLVFDLAGDDAVLDQHAAQLLWNLNTDNFVPERRDPAIGWNSLFLEEPGDLSGRVVVNLSTGTVTGEITESWTCSNDCVTPDGTPSWTTTRDTGWTATIIDGTITPDATGGAITGTVAIKYKTAVTAIENPSDCGGEPCYLCQERLCKVDAEATATAALEGWVDGDRLSLFFADRLEEDVTAMDLTGMRETEFFISRFSFTQTGIVAPAEAEPPPPEEPTDPDPAEPPPQDADVELPTGDLIPGVGAGSPPADFGDDSPTAEDSAADTPATEPTDDDETSPLGSFILAVALLVGVTAAILIVRQLIKSGAKKSPIETAAQARTAQQAAQDRSAWFSSQATHVLEPSQYVHIWNPDLVEQAKAKGLEPPTGIGPLPTGLVVQPQRPEERGPLIPVSITDPVTVIYDPSQPNIAVLRTGTHVWLNPGQLTALPSGDFAPTSELIGTQTIRADAEDGTAGYAYQPGTPVQVITTAGDKTLVRVDAKTRVWVPRSSIGSATAQIDPP